MFVLIVVVPLDVCRPVHRGRARQKQEAGKYLLVWPLLNHSQKQKSGWSTHKNGLLQKHCKANWHTNYSRGGQQSPALPLAVKSSLSLLGYWGKTGGGGGNVRAGWSGLVSRIQDGGDTGRKGSVSLGWSLACWGWRRPLPQSLILLGYQDLVESSSRGHQALDSGYLRSSRSIALNPSPFSTLDPVLKTLSITLWNRNSPK